MKCESHGALYELAKMIASRNNFTLDSIADPNNNWGVLPENGIYNRTHGKWGGVMGKVRHMKLTYICLYWAFVMCALMYCGTPKHYLRKLNNGTVQVHIQR